ncbi:MAG TPA: hypothetical protein VFE53_14470 [Mucilaginibacter sp.]|jgi:hypothetical protein|nr:hypothetical protein [Mucilaginibacter sp.]
MKKILFFLTVLLLGSSIAKSQSVKFSDLVYMTPMNNDAVYATLKQGGVFKQDYSEQVDGYPMEYFKKDSAKPDLERIETGRYTKLYDGTLLRTLDYSSTDVQNILNMVSQAKYAGMYLMFQGADEVNNIYLFSSDLYQVSIYVRRDQASGVVEIKQKEFLNID